MIAIRIILGLIAGMLMSLMLVLAVLIAGFVTLYDGLVNHDWHGEHWRELGELVSDLYDGLKSFILHG